jgi:putative toxin-antitoxin system antitoxin component (TIGR02293 family)
METVENVLATATRVFGSREQAERWLLEPAMGLDWCRPIDLLESADGAVRVERFLGQIEYCVYV